VLKKIFKKEKPRVYLGTLAVVPRTGIKKSFDSWDLTGVVELDGKLKESLAEVFCLPPSSSRIEVLESDLVLDVLISEFQLGTALFFRNSISYFVTAKSNFSFKAKQSQFWKNEENTICYRENALGRIF
jgi:hypothetical protein